MSEPVTALGGATHHGSVHVEEMPLQGMITLRGDLSDAAVKTAVQATVGKPVPDIRQADVDGDTGVCWMSPDELLILCRYSDVSATLATLTTQLGGTHALVVDVSDARAMFRMTGAHVRDAMAKLCPVDFSETGFASGDFRRSRMAQVPAAFWMPDGTSFQIICFRSVAEYVFKLLKSAAR